MYQQNIKIKLILFQTRELNYELKCMHPECMEILCHSVTTPFGDYHIYNTTVISNISITFYTYPL